MWFTRTRSTGELEIMANRASRECVCYLEGMVVRGRRDCDSIIGTIQ